LAVESSGIGGGGRASARLPCWLDIRTAGIGGFSWPFARLRRVAPARESPRRSRCCSRRHSRRASRVRCWPLRRSGTAPVVRYGTPGFPETAKSWPANRGNLFVGGAGGTAKLVQQTSVPPNARYDIAGWPGGTKTSTAELTVQFTGPSGRILGTAAIGPAGKQGKPVLDYRQAAGPVPAGAPRARVTITLTTTRTDWNGPDAPQTG
jgi:hypothetical protein